MWLNLPDRPVSGGNKSNIGSRHGMEAMREKQRGADMIEWKTTESRGAERVTSRGRGKETKKDGNTWGKNSCSWQTAARGMINSTDTSVHLTTEWKDRWMEDGKERQRKGHVVEKQTWNKCVRHEGRAWWKEMGKNRERYGWKQMWQVEGQSQMEEGRLDWVGVRMKEERKKRQEH